MTWRGLQSVRLWLWCNGAKGVRSLLVFEVIKMYLTLFNPTRPAITCWREQFEKVFAFLIAGHKTWAYETTQKAVHLSWDKLMAQFFEWTKVGCPFLTRRHLLRQRCSLISPSSTSWCFQPVLTAKFTWKLVYDVDTLLGQNLSPIEQKASEFNMELLTEVRSSQSVCATSQNNSNINFWLKLEPHLTPKIHFGKPFHMRGHFSDSINIAIERLLINFNRSATSNPAACFAIKLKKYKSAKGTRISIN